MDKPMFSITVDDKIAIITFDVAGARMNTWSKEGMDSFMKVMDEVKLLSQSSKVQGAIIISGKPDTFLAGANLNDLVLSSESKEQCEKDIMVFQACLKALTDLPIPTIAAVNGHCLGGGFELALACTARIAKKSATTVFGLPELGVGVFPAGGGTSRLTRLIGYPAIELVLTSKNIKAADALALGAIDKCIDEQEDLLANAKLFTKEIIHQSFILKRPAHDFSDADKVIEEIRKKIIKKARGRFLPAPAGFLEVVQKGIRLDLNESLALERKKFAEVASSNETKGCINTFFLNDYSGNVKKFITKGYQPKPIKKMAVLGFGAMGRGIAIDIINKAGIPVVVKDVAPAIDAGCKFVEKILQGMKDKGRLKAPVEDLMKLIVPVTEYTSDFKDVDMVIEAVFEDVKIKTQVYADLTKIVRDDCIIASNTSYLSLKDLGKTIKNPERFAGLHFFSPVWMMALVEIVRGPQTSQATVDDMLGFVAAVRKRPIICRDSPGFVVNAMLSPFMTRSLAFVEEGNVIEKVDAAFIKFGMPVGPIRLIDEVGIDVSYHIFESQGLQQDTIANMYKNGRYGFKKNGKGFFKEDGSVDPEIYKLIAYKKPPVDRTEDEMSGEILKEMVTIGKGLLDGNVIDDVRVIDMGMIFGTGYPGDKGGPMKWADITGLSVKLFGKKFYS